MQFDPDEYANVENVASSLIDSVNEPAQQEELDAQSDEAASTETEEALTAAMQRIEEANLWKVLIKDSVFQDGSARPEILASANKKIKKFALNELNKLLNINQPEAEPKKVEVQLPFEKEEILALKVFASVVLKKGMVPGFSTPAETAERTPKVKPVAASVEVTTPEVAEPTIKKVTSSANKVQNVTTAAAKAPTKPAATAAAPANKQRRRPGRTNEKGGIGYALPTTPRLPIPTADQLIGTMQMPSADVSTQNISQKELSKITNTQSLVQAVVGQLTGGNVVAKDETLSQEEDINGRL